MDFKNLGEKLFQTVTTRSRSFLSSSDRPEVPARAAAAAAVARTISLLPPHQRISIAALPGETASVYGGTSQGAKAEPLEEEFFEKDFDPVGHMLEHILENGTTQTFFDNQVSQRLLQLDAITEQLSRQVMEHHEEMVKGMQLVMELEKDLQVTTIICKNGRRHLSLAMHEVRQDLLVTANVKKKQALLDMLPIFERIQHASDIKSQLERTVDDGNYAKALRMCSECLQSLEECSELLAVQDMNQSIEEWLHKTILKVDAVLLDVCHKFDVERYVTVIDAYAIIDDISSLADKVQAFFAQIIVSETHAVLKKYFYEGEDPDIQKKSRLPYNDLCLRLPEAKYRACLYETLEILFNLLCSYHLMMTCQDALKAQIISIPDGVVVNGKHQRSHSHGNLRKLQDIRHVHTGSLSSFENFSERPAELPFGQALTTEETSIKEKSSDEPVKSLSGSLGEAADGLASNGISNKLRSNALLNASKALEKGRKTVWELAARRVSALLSSDAICATSPHNFLQSLDSVNKFILAGEAFSAAEALPLRAKLVKQCEKYFSTFHRQNLEVLRMMLEKETWQQIPPSALKNVNLVGLTGDGAPVFATALKEAHPSSIMESAVFKVGERTDSQDGFSEWMSKGNPFMGSRVYASQAGDIVEGNGDMNIGEPAKSTENGGTSMKQTKDDDEDDENEDLLADFIDEDSQKPGHVDKSFSDEDSDKFVLTNSSISILRCIDRYARLMVILQPIALEVFKGSCQIFELYFFTIFKVFGQRDAFSTTRGQADMPSLLTSRLRATLVRISQQLEEQRLKSSNGSSTTPLGAYVSDVAASGPPGQGSGAGMISSSNSYAMKERAVASESLVILANMLRRSRSRFQSLLPQTTSIIDQFFSRTVDVVDDLREHVYKTAARLLLNLSWYPDRISNTKWDLKELGTEHNGYVDLLLGEYKHYSNRLSQAGIPKEVQAMLLEYGVMMIAETLVEGISRVRKCNNEGRALMSLDLQVLINGLQHLAPVKLRSILQIVETYIKAFYLPETEYLHWVRAHPEYSRGQVIALINLVASTNNWKRKTRTDLLDKIENGDF